MAKNIREAATIKSRVLRISRELAGLLTDKALPESLRKQVESFSTSLKKTWAQLESEAGQEHGHRGVASKEGDLTDYESNSTDPAGDLTEGDYSAGGYVPVNITSFTALDAAQAASEIAETMRERVTQFQMMLNNIFFWSDPAIVPDKIQAASDLFDEFIGVVGNVLTGQDDGEGPATPVAGGETTPSEAGSFAESYEPAISLVEAEGDTSPRGPLEMDVQLIRPGWGNTRDNHYYPAEMLRRDAKVFEGAKMYTTDHRQDEKNVNTEVSKIQRIIGFTEQGAPIARVVVFDPDFAEKCRNRAKAKELETLECSILADGKARPGFEEGGRKGKVVESITAVSSVDWVTRAGAGGKALSLAESEPAPEEIPAAEEIPAVESETPVQPVNIREGDQEPEVTPADPPTPDPVQEVVILSPVYLGEAEIRAGLSKVNLPAASVLELVFGKYETAESLTEAIQAEVKRIKEISGSGRPFGLGESAPVSVQPASRAQIEEVMDKVNSRFGIGRKL